MKKQSVNRFIVSGIGCLTLLLIVLAMPAGYGDCRAVSAEASDLPSRVNDAVDLVWVRQDPPIINVNNDPTYIGPVEPRFAGSYTEYTVTDTEIAMDTRYVDNGYEWYAVVMKTVFGRPPIVLNPALRYKVTATASHSGTSKEASPGLQFWYSSPNGSVIEPQDALRYYPFDSGFTGLSTKDWMINPPAIFSEKDTFKIYAGWWNCPPCNVTWTYQAEPANAVTRLGVEVVEPIVIYQGQEVAPGNTFYPETCPTTITQTLGSCYNEMTMHERAGIWLKCAKGEKEKVLLILELLGLSEEGKKLILSILAYELIEHCGYPESAIGADGLNQADAFRLDLALDQGAMYLTNVVAGQTTSVKTPLGTAVAAAQGGFLTAYNPDTNVATFRAYSTPLTLQPNVGSNLILQPSHEVKLTLSGFGPVTKLPTIYLPLLMH